MTTFTFATAAAEQAAIDGFAAKVARMVRQDYRMAGASTADAPATEIWDLARDYAYDVLLAAQRPGQDLVDLLLLDVTDIAADKVMA
jgi:hypothetical protein